MTAFTLSNQDAFLKEVYTDEKILEQSFSKNALLALVQKEVGYSAGGRRYIQPVEYQSPSGASADYASAMQDNTVSKYLDFILSRQKQYQRIQINNELLYATTKKSDAFVNALKEFDRGIKNLGEKIGRRLYRTQGGALGQLSITGSLATTTLTFTDNAACFNFFVDQVLQFSTTDGSGSLLDSGDTTTVTAVDEESGNVTIADTLNAKIAGITSSSFVFARGDYNACISGLADWLPGDPSTRATLLAATFNNIVRNVSPVRLGGVFLDGTTVGDLDAVIIKLTGKITKYGGETSHIFANPESISDLEIVSNSKIRILKDITTNLTSADGKFIIGINGYLALCGAKAVEIYPDRNCPSNRLYALQLDTWRLWHTGEWINWTGEMATGLRLRPSENEDSVEARLGAYQNLGCSAPGWNGVARLNPSS
jgi:hypothetical protein